MGQKILNEYTTPGLLNLNRLCILDTETGGEDPNDYSILSIACVVWEAGQELDSREWFICEQPEPIVKQSALDVNHIDYNWIVENGLPPVKVFADFEAFLTKWFGGIHFNNSIRLLGHNLPFDIRFLKRFLHHAEVYKRGYSWFDQRFQRNHIDTLTHVLNTIEAFKLPYPSSELPNLKLGTCLKYFGVEEENTHEALADAKATGQLYTKLLQQMNPNYPERPKAKRKKKVE
jgi:DNA polymerase III, alpha subunit (gram-positive type)